MTQKDKQTVRELARQYMEMATSERQLRMDRRMQDTNDLKLTRPPVLIDEIPWGQMDIGGELTCLCEEPRARSAEMFFRTAIYRWKHFKADTLFEPFFRVQMAYDSTGMGVAKEEETLRSETGTDIVSHKFRDVLEDESALDRMHIPQFTLRPDKDAENMEFYTDLFGDTIPVRLCGSGYFYCSPWDKICEWRTPEAVLYDMYDRPEYLHRIMKKYMEAVTAQLDFMESHMPMENGADLHCTPGYISGLTGHGCRATWFRGMAQMFSSVSPAMHKEFEINYIKPVAERFAYTYYGCCEPLDNKMDVITEISNLRKVGVSPWADPAVMAEKIGGKYVFARKPNPANVAIRTDPDVIRRETEESVKLCIRYGCPAEFVLKDISTVSHRPENLIVWADTVSAVMDEYYGEG